MHSSHLANCVLYRSSTDPRLIIFIGPPKTGTTSINNSISNNTRPMRSNLNVFGPSMQDPFSTDEGVKSDSFSNYPKGRMINTIAKVLCHDPSCLHIKDSDSAGVSILSSEYFFSHLDGVQRLIDHCSPFFSRIEVVLIKRNLTPLIISRFSQSAKIISNSVAIKNQEQRYNTVKQRMISLVSCTENISLAGFSPHWINSFKKFCERNESIAVRCLNYDKSSDIVVDFFDKILYYKKKIISCSSNLSSSSDSDLSRVLHECIDDYKRQNPGWAEFCEPHFSAVDNFLQDGEPRMAIKYLLELPNRKKQIEKSEELFDLVLNSCGNIEVVN